MNKDSEMHSDWIDRMIAASVVSGTGAVKLSWGPNGVNCESIDLMKSKKDFAIQYIKQQPFFDTQSGGEG